MNKGSIKTIISDQRKEKEYALQRERIIDREQRPSWERFTDSPSVKVTMGVRRSGKTVFTHLLLGQRNYGFVNFDDERLAFLDREGLNDLLEGLYEVYGELDYLLLDEIQNVTGWELFVNRLPRRGIRVFVTGSNANLLSRELSTHLTGRFVQMELLPFSFREFLLWRGFEEDETTTKGRAMLKRQLTEYTKIGGFPEVVRAPELRNTYLSNLYSSIIAKDIIARHRIRYVRTFREMAANIISNFSNYITYNKLKNVHGLKSVHTAKNYVDLLTEAYLVFTIDKYSPKPREIVNSPKKVYAIDTGLIDTIALSSTENRGRIIENLAFLELLRWRSLNPSVEIYYWKDYQGHEIDFVIKKGPEVTGLIQVTYVSGMDELEKRELRSLLKGSELLGCKNLILITWDLEGRQTMDGRGIRFVPLWKWLLKAPMEWNHQQPG
ncbi:MAG: ATP-binding protein [Thermoplasmata archaeon]|nr:ATP-binding protein [Thermoplasmata archaeon]